MQSSGGQLEHKKQMTGAEPTASGRKQEPTMTPDPSGHHKTSMQDMCEDRRSTPTGQERRTATEPCACRHCGHEGG
jgi:hypothetical protein